MSGPMRFGTDGVRGPAGVWPIDADGARALGGAVAAWCGRGAVIIGQDTRESSPELAAAVEAGLVSGGARALRAGVLPTPALSCAVAASDAVAGVMITASHNLWMDNGLKVLGADGAKPEREEELEALLAAPRDWTGAAGRAETLEDPAAAWRAALPCPRLDGVRILLDCGHGAAAAHAPAVLRALGADLSLIGCAPDGRNINADCGALHPPDATGFDVAIALDGDGDRLALVDPDRGALDGDDLLWLMAGSGEAPVVGTVLANGGLEAALGGRLLRVPVGDKHVAAGMRASGAQVGGEPSGHLIYVGGPPTSCGLATALAILAGGLPLAPRLAGFERWPSAAANLPLQGAATVLRPDLDALSEVRAARAAGVRVVARYSGTEALVRVMVEGADARAWVDRILAELST